MTVVSEDRAAAKQAARILVAFYISSMPPEQLARHGIDADELAPVVEALGARRRPEGDRACSSPTTPRSSPRRHARGGRREDQDRHRAGGREPHDPRRSPTRALVKLFSGEDVPNVPDIQGQLKLVAERVMPAFGDNRTPSRGVPPLHRWRRAGKIVVNGFPDLLPPPAVSYGVDAHVRDPDGRGGAAAAARSRTRCCA